MGYALMFDPDAGLQIYDTDSGQVADLAVLHETWRKPGDPLPQQAAEEEDEVGGYAQPGSLASFPLQDFGGLRIRSRYDALYRH